MKLRFLLAPLAAATVLSGCVTTQGGHTYVDGRCITCINNPMTGEAVNYEAQPQQPIRQVAARKGPLISSAPSPECRIPKNRFDRTRHHLDERWCSEVTLPGASLTEYTDFSVTVPVDIDIAYFRAKRQLKFTDSDDKGGANSGLHTSERWDGIPGKFYSNKALYGGPMQRMLWFADYSMQLERISNTQTRVSVQYRTYGRMDKRAEFKNNILAAIKG